MGNHHTDLSGVSVKTAPSPATSGTSIVVTDANAAYLPSEYPWWAGVKPASENATRANTEIMKVTAGSSSGGDTTYTIVRAQGVPVTTARTIIAGDTIYEAVAAQDMIDRETLSFYDSGNITMTSTPNAIEDITGATVTFTPAVVSVVKITFQLVIQNNTDTDYFVIDIYKDGNPLVQTTYRPPVAGIGAPLSYIYFDDNVTVASHTYKLRWTNSHTGDQLQCVRGRLYAEEHKT